MPFISVQTSLPVSEGQKDELQREIGALVECIPDKNVHNCMTRIEGGCSMYMGGGPANVAYCDVRLFTPAPKEAKSAFTAGMDALLRQVLGIEMLYTSFVELPQWGVNDQLKG